MILPLPRTFVCVPYTPHGAGNEWTDDGENNHVGRIVQAEQQSRTGDRHDKRDSADDRPAEERPSSVCTTVTFSIGEAYAREITRGKNHHYRYDHRGCRMTTRKTWIARQQTTASGRDRTGRSTSHLTLITYSIGAADTVTSRITTRLLRVIRESTAASAATIAMQPTVENRCASTVEQSRNPSGSTAKACKILVSCIVEIAELRSATPIAGTMPHNMCGCGYHSCRSRDTSVLHMHDSS